MAKLKKEDLEFMADEQIRDFICSGDMSILPLHILEKNPTISFNRVSSLLFVIVQERFLKNTRKNDLMKFIKYIKDVHTNSYGILEVCENGDELDLKFEDVVNYYLTNK